MALARFFDRTYAAVGRALHVSRATLEAALATTSVEVVCGDECAPEGNPRWTAELLVNLLARLYPVLAIRAPEPVRAALTQIAREINPAIEVVDGDAASAAVVVVGSGARDHDALHAGATGWVAHVQQRPLAPVGPANPYAASAAACLAAAEVFRRVFRDRMSASRSYRDVHLSLLDFGPTAGAEASLGLVDLGELAFFGLGAVANGALWALGRHRALTGVAWLVDEEDVETSNLQRYVLARDADDGAPKVALARAALAGTGLDLRPERARLEVFADSRGARFAIPTVCVSVDDVHGRRATQALLPRLVINGWTSDGGLGASWHRFSPDAACLACLYHPAGAGPSQTDLIARALGLDPRRAAELYVRGLVPSHAEMQLIAEHLALGAAEVEALRGRSVAELYAGVLCGSVKLDLSGAGRVEEVPLAHQSALAGVLMAAELVKRCDPGLEALAQPETLAAWEDVLRPPPSRWVQPRTPTPGCICRDGDYRRVFDEKWSGPSSFGALPTGGGTSRALDHSQSVRWTRDTDH